MNQPPQYFTAARIGQALGRTRQAMRRALAQSPPDGQVAVSGQTAQGWSFSSLPVAIQTALETAAQAAGCRDAFHLLSASGRNEAPAPKRPAPRQIISLASEVEFQNLRADIAGFKKPGEPNLAEKSYVWLMAIETYEAKLAEGKAPKKMKRHLMQFLARNAPFLVKRDCASPLNSLRVNFQNKYNRWLESDRSPQALADARPVKSGNRRAPELSTDDRDKLIHHAVTHCGGRLAQAWREMGERNGLSESILSYYLHNPARKSEVPEKIVESVKYEVAMQEDEHHGPRQAKLNGAYIFRDWSKVPSMDWMQSDDATKPVYFKAVDQVGNTTIMRGQVLPMIDLRSTRILGFVLISRRNYNANTIRSLMTRVSDEFGLPKKGYYYENGTWRAKIITGDPVSGAMSWPETKLGLREFGVRFVHAGLPRAKPIERVIGALQDLMEGLPGYCGRNEQIERFERFNRLKIRAEKGDPVALSSLMDENQWANELENICARYNAAVQNGIMTEGLSPDAAFEQFQNRSDPPIKFSPQCRYLLAHHRRPANVTSNGITLRFGKEVFNYRNAETGRLRGQKVLTWFDPENAEILTVTDMNRQNAFCIPRTQEVPAMDAPTEILSQELARIAEHQSYAKARYRILKAKYSIPFRTMIADRDALDLGAQIGQQRAAIETEAREVKGLESRARKAAGKMGLALPHGRRIGRGNVESLERLEELLSDDSQTETKGTP